MFTQPGLLFIKSRDPLSLCLQNLRQTEYTAYGFYLPTKVSGTPQGIVYLYDQLGRMAPLWSEEETTLAAIQTNPYVTAITFRPVITGAEYFRAAVLDVLRQYPILRQPKAIIREFLANPPGAYSPLQQKVLDWMESELQPVTKDPAHETVTVSLLDPPVNLEVTPSEIFPLERTALVQLIASFIDLLLSQPDLIQPRPVMGNLYAMTRELVMDLQNGRHPALDVNQLIAVTNSLYPHQKPLPTFCGEKSYPATLTLTTPGDVKISPSLEKVLTTNAFQLDGLTADQLQALAKELDSNGGTESCFDKLRASVATRLAEMHIS